MSKRCLLVNVLSRIGKPAERADTGDEPRVSIPALAGRLNHQRGSEARSNVVASKPNRHERIPRTRLRLTANQRQRRGEVIGVT